MTQENDYPEDLLILVKRLEELRALNEGLKWWTYPPELWRGLVRSFEKRAEGNDTAN